MAAMGKSTSRQTGFRLGSLKSGTGSLSGLPTFGGPEDLADFMDRTFHHHCCQDPLGGGLGQARNLAFDAI